MTTFSESSLSPPKTLSHLEQTTSSSLTQRQLLMKEGVRPIDTTLFNTFSGAAELFLRARGYKCGYYAHLFDILRACEDYRTITEFSFHGKQYPFAQTNQMNLEWDLLENLEQNKNGLFTWSWSLRDEPGKTMVPGRHERSFPMLEIEKAGTMDDLIDEGQAFFKFLGFPLPEGRDSYPIVDYEDMCQKYGVKDLSNKEELLLEQEYGSVVFLINFPERTYPYWNMGLYPRVEGRERVAKKLDIIVGGHESWGSAERSCNKQEMRDLFDTIENGEYKERLFQISKQRTLQELKEYLDHTFVHRIGAGIGVQRVMSALTKYNLWPQLQRRMADYWKKVNACNAFGLLDNKKDDTQE